MLQRTPEKKKIKGKCKANILGTDLGMPHNLYLVSKNFYVRSLPI